MDKKNRLRKKYARKIRDAAFLKGFHRAENWQTRESFLQLIDLIRHSTELLNQSAGSGRARIHQIEQIFELCLLLSKARKYWIRDLMDWEPARNVTFRIQIGDLLRHLLTTHNVPAFMDCAWWLDDSAAAKHRKWFRHIGRGNSIRGIAAAGITSKRQEIRFLSAPQHYSIAQAIEWSKGENRSVRISAIYPAGLTRRRRKRRNGPKFAILWQRIEIKDFYLFDERNRMMRLWQIKQIRRPGKLSEEGQAMRHCVASYADWCAKGKTTIWSMTCQNYCLSDQNSERVLTIEVLPSRQIIEALGFQNRQPYPDELYVLRQWAQREKLRIADQVAC